MASALFRLTVGDQPDVGVDAGVVEELIRQGDDGVEPIVFDDPAADVGRAGAGVAGKQRRAVEDDGDLRAGHVRIVFIERVHLGEHVLQEQQRAVVDRR